MLASLPTNLATLSMAILIAILAFTINAYAAPVPASADATPAADIIHIEEKPLSFVNTILSRRAEIPAKPEGDLVFGQPYYYRRDVEDKAEAATPSPAKPKADIAPGQLYHYRRDVEDKAEAATPSPA